MIFSHLQYFNAFIFMDTTSVPYKGISKSCTFQTDPYYLRIRCLSLLFFNNYFYVIVMYLEMDKQESSKVTEAQVEDEEKIFSSAEHSFLHLIYTHAHRRIWVLFQYNHEKKLSGKFRETALFLKTLKRNGKGIECLSYSFVLLFLYLFLLSNYSNKLELLQNIWRKRIKTNSQRQTEMSLFIF